MNITKLVLIRHGESKWNLENRFTGWTDVGLSKNGIIEAKKAGKLLKKLKFNFDYSYSSFLKRAINTLHLILNELNQLYIPVIKSWRLNERHYGSLQGLNKEYVCKKYGKNQFNKWRRGFFDIPPKIKVNDYRFPGNFSAYSDIKKEELPTSESLKNTLDRVVPFWKEKIFYKLKKKKQIIISAHGNSIRAIIKFLENISENDIVKIEIKTGSPIVYEFDELLKPIKRYYL